jgi:hypothetical protein
MPVVTAIRARRLHAQFPKRTETDLYIWITHVREKVAENYELAPLDPETAVAAFAATHSDHAAYRLFNVLRHGALRHRWSLEKRKVPPGMTKDEFCALRLRHDAGELSISEARRKQLRDALLAETMCEGHFGIQFSA